MSRYGSTLLPQTNEPAEIQKAILDLLAKINETAGGGGSASSATVREETVNYAMLEGQGDEIIKVTTGAVLITVTLPSLSSNQGVRKTVIKDKDSGVGEVLLNAKGADVIVRPSGTATGMYVGWAGDLIEVLGMADGWQMQ